MITRNLDVMLSRAGVYVLCNRGGAGVLFVEVEDGRCRQLRPEDFRRDGELSPEGWNRDGVQWIAGPLARATEPNLEVSRGLIR